MYVKGFAIKQVVLYLNIKMQYNIIPGQNGFIYICQDSQGNIIDDKTKIVTINY